MYEVFQAPIDLTADIPISSIFYYALQGSKYMPNSTKARHTQMLAEDLKAYYSEMEVLDAMENPEKYKSLTVRLYGFSEYFISLPKWQQIAVLNRTEYSI